MLTEFTTQPHPDPRGTAPHQLPSHGPQALSHQCREHINPIKQGNTKLYAQGIKANPEQNRKHYLGPNPSTQQPPAPKTATTNTLTSNRHNTSTPDSLRRTITATTHKHSSQEQHQGHQPSKDNFPEISGILYRLNKPKTRSLLKFRYCPQCY